MIQHMGKSGSDIKFHEHYVEKTCSAWEAKYVCDHPDTFVGGFQTPTGLMMPRLEVPTILDGQYVILQGLTALRSLWVKMSTPEPKENWRVLLMAKLQTLRQRLDIKLDQHRLVKLLKDGARCKIHGDPTIANLLYDKGKRQWVWCDPLQRDYIPDFKEVDVGKMLQSCWNYERVIKFESELPSFNEPLARVICEKTHADYEQANLWCLVHLIRLIPYQEERVAALYKGIVNELASRL